MHGLMGLGARLRATLGMLVLASACASGEPQEAMMNGAEGAAGEGSPVPDAADESPGATGTPAQPGDPSPADAGGPDETSPGDAGGAGDDSDPSPSADETDDAPADAQPSPRATGPGDWGPGDYPPGLTEPNYLEIAGVAGQNGPRQYKVHVPPSYEPDVPMPAVLCIHGLGQDAVLFCVTGAGWHTASDEEGFILIMPNGFQNSWNGGTCCGGASASQLDDVALLRAILEEVGTHVNIDLDRVYATGLSNGGYMSYRLACEAADLFAAVAPGAGAVGINDIGGGTNPMSDFTACEPSQPVSVLHIHGTDDPLVPYMLQAPSLARFAESAGCDSTPVPASAPPSAGDTECVSYEGCQDGVEITGCTVQEGGHCWFGSDDCGTGGGDIGLSIVGNNSDTLDNNTAIIDFFRRNAR